MSNQEPSSNNTSSSTPEQIPHSGVHGYEKPVREFDKTPLGEAHEKGLIETPHSPATLIEPEKKDKKKKLSTAQKMSIGAIAFTIVPAVAAGLWTKKQMNDVEDAFLENSDTPTAVAPAVPGAEAPVDTPEFHFTIEPVVLTDAEVAALEGGDSEESREILDAKLIPKIQEAVDQIRENGSKLEGLDLSALAPTKRGLATLANLDDGRPVEVCQTTPNVDGSLNFCGSNHPTKIELGKPIEFWVNDVATEKDYRFKSSSHIEVTDDNRLILAHDN